jgi:hypothetical protein
MGLHAHVSCARAGFGPRPSFRPYGYHALQGEVGLSGLKVRVSNRPYGNLALQGEVGLSGLKVWVSNR